VKKLPGGTIFRRCQISKSGGASLDVTTPNGAVTKVHIKQ